MRRVVGEVKHGAADDGVERRVRPRKTIEIRHLKPLGIGVAAERFRELADVRHRRRVAIDAPALESLREQVAEVPPVAAAGVEHPRAMVEAPLEELIEEINVDVAEVGSERGARGRRHRCPSCHWCAGETQL